jgi:hypothetical protein
MTFRESGRQMQPALAALFSLMEKSNRQNEVLQDMTPPLVSDLRYGQIKYFFRLQGSPEVMMHSRWMVPASDSILGEVASPREMMFCHCQELAVDKILRPAQVSILHPGDQLPEEGLFCR